MIYNLAQIQLLFKSRLASWLPLISVKVLYLKCTWTALVENYNLAYCYRCRLPSAADESVPSQSQQGGTLVEKHSCRPVIVPHYTHSIGNQSNWILLAWEKCVWICFIWLLVGRLHYKTDVNLKYQPAQMWAVLRNVTPPAMFRMNSLHNLWPFTICPT